MAVTAEDIKMRIIAENAADRAVKQFSTSIKNVDKGVGRLSGNLKALGGIAAGAFAVQGLRKMNDFVSDSIKLAQVQQDAETKLATALGYKSQALLDNAAALQQATTYGDEQIIEAQALIASFVQEESHIKKATAATLDLAKAKGMDLKAAADLVSKTLGSSTNALSRYGITVEGTVGSSKRLDTMVSAIADKFGGQAAAAAKIHSGRLDQLANDYGDLKEEIGFAVMESGAFDSALDALNPAVDEMTTYIVDHKDDIGDFAQGLVGTAVGAARGAVNIADDLTPALKGLYGILQKIMDVAGAVPGGWATLMGMAAGARFGGVPGAIIGGAVAGSTTAIYDAAKGYGENNRGFGSATSPFAFRSKLFDNESTSPFRDASQINSLADNIGYLAEGLDKVEEKAKKAKDALNEAGNASENAEDPVGGLGDKTRQAASEALAWEKALQAAQKSLDGTNDEVLSVADATKQQEAAEQALKTAIAGGIKNRKAVEAATKDHDKATKAAAKSVKQYEEETNAANKAILSAQKFMRKHGETLEKHGISTDRMTDLQRALAEEYRREEPRIERIIELQRLLGLEIDNTANIMSDSVRAYQNATADIVDAVGQIGVVFAESAGISIAGIGVLQDAIQHLQGDGTPGSENDLLGYLGIANFVGQNIGGSVGGVISSTAGMASAGASLATALGASTGNPIGAIIGGAVGLISSIFGGGDYEEERAAREEARTETYNTLVGLANEGGLYSRALIQAGGGTYQGLSDLVPDADLERRLGREFGGNRLLADYGHGRAEEIAREASAIDSYFITVHESINNALGAASVEEGADALRQNIQGQLEYALQQVVVTSLMDEALLPAMLPIINEMRGVIEAEGTISQEQIDRYRAQTESVVDMAMPVFEAAFDIFGKAETAAESAASAWNGFAADSLTSTILQSFAMAENEGGNIGDTFVSNFTASIEDGLMNFAASQLVENVLSGMMEPVMTSIAEAFSSAQMVSASLIESSMAQITDIAKQAAPYVESLYEAFGGSIKAVVPTVRYSSGGGSAASARSKDGFADAIRNLESFRAGMFADAKIAPGNIGALQAQQSAVRTLVAQARQGADEDSRIAAMRDLPGAVSSSLQSALAMTADPLEYSRQVGEMSNMLAGVTGGRDATLRNVVTEIRELRRENEQLREIMVQLLDSGNENTDKLVSLTREMVENSY